MNLWLKATWRVLRVVGVIAIISIIAHILVRAVYLWAGLSGLFLFLLGSGVIAVAIALTRDSLDLKRRGVVRQWLCTLRSIYDKPGSVVTELEVWLPEDIAIRGRTIRDGDKLWRVIDHTDSREVPK